MSASPRAAVLDHGYVELVEAWGSDERIIEAARMSTAKGFQGWGPTTTYARQCGACMMIEGEPGYKDGCSATSSGFHDALSDVVTRVTEGDEKLLRYLWQHAHLTPFEMAGLVVEVQAPLFVLREWHRHRTQSYNELSARYAALPNLCYVPSVERLMAGGQSKANRQGGGEPWCSPEEAATIRAATEARYGTMRAWYEELLESGMARELARLVVPVAQYSRMRASANLRNWLAFLALRLAPGAQWEIRQYAQAVGKLVGEYFPKTWGLFIEGGQGRPVPR